MNINIVVIENQVAIMEALLLLNPNIPKIELDKLYERIFISKGIILDSA